MSQPGRQAIDWLSLPTMRPVAWWRDALRLWRRAPIRWVIACVLVIAFEAPFQLIPYAGVALSKVIGSLLGIGAYAVMDELVRNGRFRWRELFWSLRPRNFPAALVLAMVNLSLLAFDALAAFTAYGHAGVDRAIFGNFAQHPELATDRFSLVVLLPGFVPITLLMFAAPLVVLGGVSPLKAVAWSVRWLASRPAAFAITLGIWWVLVAMALTHKWLFLLVLPWGGAQVYAAYVDVFGRDAPPTREGLPPSPSPSP